MKFKFLPTLILSILSLILLISCEDSIIDRRKDYKPNIYMYPDSTIQVDVYLSFPHGGEVLTSIPNYASGWHVSVDSAGIIDNEYEYLFYESEQPDEWQRTEGWLVTRDDLEAFFINNMKTYGFAGRVIDDFIEYWIPRLTTSKYYAVYPQTGEVLESLIGLSILPEPDQLLRVHYLVLGQEDNAMTLKEPPVRSDFKREGYFATEWGVVL